MTTRIIYTYAECDAAPNLSCSADGAPVRVTEEPADCRRAECSGPNPHRWAYSAEKAEWKSA